jgi:hypothetical protein
MPFARAAMVIPAGHQCAHCGKYGATWKAAVATPDDSWECYRYWCNTTCHANWGTNQDPAINRAPKRT